VDESPLPVFVDDSGRRRALARRVGRLVALGFVGYLALLAAGFARDPRLGAIGLPTFGLPGLVHPGAAPAVLGESATRSASAGADPADPGNSTQPGRSDQKPRNGGPVDRPTAAPVHAATAPSGGTTTGPGPTATNPTTSTTGVTTTTGPAATGHSPKGSTTTTTSPTTTTTPTTTSTTSPAGPGNSGSSTPTAKGPDGSGPPGQLHRPTTTTTTSGQSG